MICYLESAFQQAELHAALKAVMCDRNFPWWQGNTRAPTQGGENVGASGTELLALSGNLSWVSCVNFLFEIISNLAELPAQCTIVNTLTHLPYHHLFSFFRRFYPLLDQDAHQDADAMPLTFQGFFCMVTFFFFSNLFGCIGS